MKNNEILPARPRLCVYKSTSRIFAGLQIEFRERHYDTFIRVDMQLSNRECQHNLPVGRINDPY